MTRDYEQVREDLKGYLETNSMTQNKFSEVFCIPPSNLSRFMTGTNLGEQRKKRYMEIISTIIYPNETKTEDVQNELEVKNEEIEKEDTLDDTITKLIDKKIEETMKQISELETKVKNLEASRDIIKELLD